MEINGYKAVPPMAELDRHERFANVHTPYRVYLADCRDVQNGHLPGRYYFRMAGDIGPRPVSHDYATASEAILAATGVQRSLSLRPILDTVTISAKAAELEARDNVTL